MSERHVVDAVSAENVRKHVEYVCEHIPSRLAGSENARRMAEYNAAALRAVGVEATVRDTPGLVSFPKPGKLQVLEPESLAIEAFTSGHSLLTPPGGVTGELVYVGSGGVRDFAGKNVAGKLVLCEISYSPARMEKQRLAALNGAIGAVMMNWGNPGDTALPFGSIKPAWGNPTAETVRDEMPRMPSVGVARASGLRLKAMCERAVTRAKIETNVENGWRPIQVTWARSSRPRARTSSWSADIRIPGMDLRRPTMQPGMPSWRNWLVCSTRSASIFGAASCSVSGAPTRPEPWSAPPGSRIATGIG